MKRRFSAPAAWALFVFAAPGVAVPPPFMETLEAVRAEVKELGRRPGEDFISWNFFIGARNDEDDDDTNKERHVAVLIQEVGGREKMTIVVTRLEAAGGKPGVRIAGESKSLSCAVSGGVLSILGTDFKAEEIPAVVRDILRAVRNKKKLLREGPHAP
jgi:hypothetical protein